MAPASWRVVGENPSDTHIVTKENHVHTWPDSGTGSMSLLLQCVPSGATDDSETGTSHAFKLKKLLKTMASWRIELVIERDRRRGRRSERSGGRGRKRDKRRGWAVEEHGW
jgi:hypothetical protein